MEKRNIQQPLIGAHVSVAGGLHKGIDRALAIGAETIQIFGSAPVRWASPTHGRQDLDLFLTKHRESGIGPVFLHAIYLVNIASPEERIRNRSLQSLIDHLELAERLGAEGLVFHPGSARGDSRERAINRIVGGLETVVKAVPGKAKLILENTAGGGDHIGSTIEEIGLIYSAGTSRRLAVCLDTAHAVEAGILNTSTPKTVRQFFDHWDSTIGLNALAVIHANDSKTAAGSHHDRHENIGQGIIGLAGFKILAAAGHLNHIPWIIETPGFNKQGPDRKNIEILKSAWR